MKFHADRLHLISRQILDVTANEQAIAYAAQAEKDTKAAGSSFASFYFCDWESLRSRPISEGAYLQLKFGEAGAYAADCLGEIFTCRAARLPDGGCAVLSADAKLRLFRPGGRLGACFPLEYRGTGAYDIAGDSGNLWFTAPAQNALALFSLQAREIALRVGGPGVFARPGGVFLQGHSLFVCCSPGGGPESGGEVKTMLLPSCDLGETLPVELPPEKYFAVFRRAFLWAEGALYAILHPEFRIGGDHV